MLNQFSKDKFSTFMIFSFPTKLIYIFLNVFWCKKGFFSKYLHKKDKFYSFSVYAFGAAEDNKFYESLACLRYLVVIIINYINVSYFSNKQIMFVATINITINFVCLFICSNYGWLWMFYVLITSLYLNSLLKGGRIWSLSPIWFQFYSNYDFHARI